MSLLPGTKLGPYEILSPIGAGGMGEVYKARDSKLDRFVAVKVISEKLAGDANALARFEREAKAVAALSHPHILAIHDFGREGDVTYAVTELLEGQSLRDRLEAGPLPISKVAEIATQIAEGLAAAHGKGIVHRDLKPGNIFVTMYGQVKILDFGLATLAPKGDLAGGGPSEVTTKDAPTHPGSVLGTIGYMAPEQLRGDAADARSDIFAFGVVLYEMLAGRPPFERASAADTMAAILLKDPDPLPPLTPPGLDRIVKRCLEKRPEDRFSSAHDLAFALEAVSTSGAGSSPAWQMLYGKPRRRWGWIAAALATIAAASAVTALWYRTAAKASQLPPFESKQLTSRPGLEGQPALSPDGNTVAFTVQLEGGTDIWVMDVHGGPTLRLTADGASNADPAWFPDGSALAFDAARGGVPGIFKVSRLGGAAIPLVSNAVEPAVSPDGTRIAFARSEGGRDYRIWVASLSEPHNERRLTSDSDGTWNHERPAWSPDGTSLCYQDQNDLWIVAASGGKARRLTADDPSDRDPAWSPDGRYVYFDSLREGPSAVWRVRASGGPPERVTMGTGMERYPALSRDGRKLAYATTGRASLVVINRQTGQRFDVSSGSTGCEPAFTPDGGAVIFASDREGGNNLWKVRLRGGRPDGEPERLTENGGNCANLAVSPDGKWIAYHRVVSGQRDVWVVPAEGGPPVNFTGHPAADAQPRWSPDGSKIAFFSERSGSSQIWVAPFKDGRRSGEPRQVTRGEGTHILGCWSPDGKQIACIVCDDSGSDVWAAAADGTGAPVRLTTGAGATWMTRDPVSGRLLVLGLWGGIHCTARLVPFPGGEGGTADFPVPTVPNRELLELEVSPDGRFLATLEEIEEGDVWLLEATKGSF